MWLRICGETLQIDSDRMTPVITTDGASNMRAAGRKADEWYWMWCICHILHLAVSAGWEAVSTETDFIIRVKEFVRHMH